MLICPQCSFENPDQNRFCQQCGYALQMWRAYILLRSASAQPGRLENAPLLSDLLPESPYLDDSRRYRLQGDNSEPLSVPSITTAVIDCQPAVPSPLADLQASILDTPEEDPVALAAASSLPAEAIPYLVLQTQFFPTVPLLHDAWENAAYVVLLLEDRSSWSLLSDMWRLGAVDPLQQLHWFYKMAELWDALKPWQAQTSLLDAQNLRVDEDQIFCLACLQADRPEATLTLSDLGHFWQNLLEPVQETVPPELIALIEQLADGKVASVSDLHAQLVQLADLFQAEPPIKPVEPLPLAAGIADAVEADALGLNVARIDECELEEGAIASPQIPSAPSVGEPSAGPADEFAPLTPITVEPSPAPDIDIPPLDVTEESALEDTAPINLGGEDAEENLDLPTMVLPMKIVRLDEAGRTHVGRQRDHNEDFFSAQTSLIKLEGPQGTSLSVKGLYILCDGMGGHASGEVASSLAVKTLQDYFVESPADSLPSEATLLEAVASANEAIYDINQGDARMGHSRMGTTLVMLLLNDDRAAVAHVGDSRLYAYTRRTGLKQVTVDHEVGQREIQRGVEPAIAYARPDAYQLTQALGPRSRDDLRPGVTFIDITEDTLFILCSDGLSDNDLLEQHCATHIEPLLHSQADLEDGANKLIDLANEYNGHDNITAVLVRIKLRPNMDKLPAL